MCACVVCVFVVYVYVFFCCVFVCGRAAVSAGQGVQRRVVGVLKRANAACLALQSGPCLARSAEQSFAGVLGRFCKSFPGTFFAFVGFRKPLRHECETKVASQQALSQQGSPSTRLSAPARASGRRRLAFSRSCSPDRFRGTTGA